MAETVARELAFSAGDGDRNGCFHGQVSGDVLGWHRLLEPADVKLLDHPAEPDRGEVANYIPELASVHDKRFGLVVIDGAGNLAAAGDSEMPFSIQSISKVFTLTLALGLVGDKLWQRVGR